MTVAVKKCLPVYAFLYTTIKYNEKAFSTLNEARRGQE